MPGHFKNKNRKRSLRGYAKMKEKRSGHLYLARYQRIFFSSLTEQYFLYFQQTIEFGGKNFK
jgi:hypothetical protein